MDDVKFISYDGKWPCLCGGTLVIEVKGKVYNLEYALVSTGYADWHTDEIGRSPWRLAGYAIPEEIKQYSDIILELVNDNVPWGCCGGCI